MQCDKLKKVRHMKEEVKAILIALNSTNDMGFKYPIGNKELTIKVRELESNGIIIYNPVKMQWFKRTNNILNSLN